MKQYLLAFPDWNLSSPENWAESCVETRHLVAALWGRKYFWSRYHAMIIKVVRTEIWKWNTTNSKRVLAKVTVKPLPTEVNNLK